MKYDFAEYEFKELAVWMDGGSTTSYFESTKSKKLTIDLQQFVINEYYEEISKIPGRIYLNDEIVDKRSSLEKSILKFLKNNVLYKLKGAEKEILKKQIYWIESEEYINFTLVKLELSESRKKELGIYN